MLRPILKYGDRPLHHPAEAVTRFDDALQQLIDDMIETMRGAAGIGLAAPQVGRRERLFVVDLTPMAEEAAEEGEALPPQPMVLINPEILWEGPEECDYEEGCLSLPDLREVVIRPERIRICYLDRRFEPREVEVGGLLARVVQHEYDHLEGILFIDRISPFRRRLLKRRLREMAQGQVEADYPLSTGAA